MERRKFIKKSAAVTITGISVMGIAASCNNNTAGLKAGEILHTVIFDLKYPVGSAEADKFLTDGYNILTKVPGVFDFQVFRQCSPKNNFQYGFYMRFRNKADFDAYTANPKHSKFVEERWNTEVTQFQESDFQTMK